MTSCKLVAILTLIFVNICIKLLLPQAIGEQDDAICFSIKTRTCKKKITGCAPDAFSFAFHHDGMKGVAVAMAEADNVCVRDEGHSQRETIRVPPSLYPLRSLSVHPLKPFVHPWRWLRRYLGPGIIRVWTRLSKINWLSIIDTCHVCHLNENVVINNLLSSPGDIISSLMSTLRDVFPYIPLQSFFSLVWKLIECWGGCVSFKHMVLKLVVK